MKTNSIQQVFTFNPSNKAIRVEMIDSEPWFVAKDVCEALGISNSRDAMQRLDEDERATSVLPTQFGAKEMNLINESGLYNLIFQSRKPEARYFRKWVTSEVLPAIRRTGGYTMPSLYKPDNADELANNFLTIMYQELVRIPNQRTRVRMANTIEYYVAMLTAKPIKP